MRDWDSFAMVDWSSGNDRGAAPKKDAIWVGSVIGGTERAPVYLRNRQVAETWLSGLIEDELGAGRRLLLGFDFPFGYPRGFAARVVGRPDPLALWDWLDDNLLDTPTANNRFDLAGWLNGRFPGVGPFWFNGLGRDVPGLPRLGRDRHGHGLPERRDAEKRAKGAFSLWQMGGAGAVGGQAITGMAALSRLRARFPEAIAVWPFQPLDRPVGFVEIWPSLVPELFARDPDPIRDRAQVRCLARVISRLDSHTLETMLDVTSDEEGWILGLDHEEVLRETACLA